MPQPFELFLAHIRTKKVTKKTVIPIKIKMQKIRPNYPMIGFGRPGSIS